MQARLRFGWVMPGEVGYRVIGADGEVLAGDGATLDHADRNRPAEQDPDWWDTAWGSHAGGRQDAGRGGGRGRGSSNPTASRPDQIGGGKQPAKQSPSQP